MVFGAIHDWYEVQLPIVQTLITVAATFVAATLVVWVVKRILLGAAHRSRFVDATLEKFFASLLNAAAILVVAVAVLLAAGMPAAALGGLLAVFGFIVGFALQGTLGNLAAGVVLLVNRPYAVGEAVDVKGQSGTVLELGLAMTRLKTFDGRYVSVPNGAVMSEAILNHTRNPTRRATLEVAVAYEDDLDLALKTALGTAQVHPEVRAEPAPDVIVTALGDDGVELGVRAWFDTPNFLAASSDLRQQLKRDLEAAGCSIPYPQRDIHVVDGQLAAPRAT